MFELTFPLLAWLGVVVIQALVHTYLGAVKRSMVEIEDEDKHRQHQDGVDGDSSLSAGATDDDDIDALVLPLLYAEAENDDNGSYSNQQSAATALAEETESSPTSTLPFLANSLFLDSSVADTRDDAAVTRIPPESHQVEGTVSSVGDKAVTKASALDQLGKLRNLVFLAAGWAEEDFGNHTSPISDDQSLDGDEPQEFFYLLSQTGSEMVESHRSLESVVQEQIDKT